MADFLVGDHVDVNGQHAVVRFVGQTEFQTGDWIGVEYDTPTGKNNGTVQGIQYFSCRDRYGMFVRPAIPRLMERPVKPPPLKRPSIVSPPPQAKGRPLSLRSPTKPASPTKGLGSAGSSGPSTPRTNTPTMTARTPATTLRTGTNRPGSMGPPPRPPPASAPPKRQSISGATPVSRTASQSSNASSVGRPPSAANRLINRPGVVRKTSTMSNDRSSPAPEPVRRARTEAPEKRTPPSRGVRRESLGVGASAANGHSPSRSPANTPSTSNSAALAAAQREAEDLKSKIKILEKKRVEDRDKLKILERVQEERDKYEAIIQKLQAKYQPQQQEITELRKQMKEMEASLEAIEDIKADHDTIVEMATLDREMAEEQTEAYKAELEAVRGKAEELEIEVEILREENEQLSQGMSPEEKTSAGWMQLEKQNERLKEALFRLKEITENAEAELKDNIKSLEEENSELSKYKDGYEEMKVKLLNTEAGVEDLRQQLEAALGAEEMLEELTERNMNMSEQIDELRATIEDLESLKEISDELEINHVETEKAMQEEIDYKELVITEQSRKITQLDTSNEEAEYTITRFRDVVTTLQSDLEDMRASQQITETEAEELTARSRSMMDLNMKLQITAAKAQNKTIDLELRRLEAEEAMEHLAVVQMFLPDSFHNERDSILALLRFKRVAFKSQLLQTFVKERLNGQTNTLPGQEDTLMAACDVCDKLTWVSAMCERFINCINSCDVDQFTKFQGALYELDPVERALNSWIEGIRRDELKEKQCAAELQRTMALMSHLGEIHLKNDLEGFASDVHMRVLLMQSHMESAAAALSHVKVMALNKVSSDPENEEITSGFVKKADAVISHSRSAKVVIGKVLRSLDDFRQRSLSLTQDKRGDFEACEEITQKVTDYARTLGEDIYELLFSEPEEGEEKRTVSWTQLQNRMFKTTEKKLLVAESDVFGALSKELRTLTNMLVELGSVAADIDMTAEFEKAPPPWVVRAQELKNTKVVNVDVEEECRRLKEDILERATQIRLRDKTLEESAVKIELLESRMRNVTKQSERIEELERLVSEGSAREKDLTEAIESLNEEIHTLETDVAKYKKMVEDKRAVGAATENERNAMGQERAVATAKEVSVLKKEIVALQNAMAFFREENRRLKRDDIVGPESWLLQPLGNQTEKDVAEYESALVQESQDVLKELMDLTVNSRVVDLTKQPQERKKWRPTKETSRFKVLEGAERYETLAAWKEDVRDRAAFHGAAKKAIKPRVKGRKYNEVAAKVQMKLPGSYFGGKGLGGDVVIRDHEGWEEFRGMMGVDVGA